MDLADDFRNIDLKVKLGYVLFDIILDDGFFQKKHQYRLDWHTHAFFEVHFIYDGKGTLHIDDKKIKILPKSFYILAPGVYHRREETEENLIYKYCMRFNYKKLKDGDDEYFCYETKQIVDILSNLKYYYCTDTERSVRIFYKIKAIHDEFYFKRIGYYEKIQSIFVGIIIDIFRGLIRGSDNESSKVPSRLMDDKRSLIIETFLFDNYHRDIKAQDLAQELHMSVSQLNRVMRKLYNKTFKQKLIETRVKFAKEMIGDSDLSIREISKKVGYSSQSNFCSMFKRVTGMLPKDYKGGQKR
ncbi:MAG: AraC family transcriptional regulator [Clostridia bacterium]|nr:AraC family transcriptional regulator [Clostridia bacterium]